MAAWFDKLYEAKSVPLSYAQHRNLIANKLEASNPCVHKISRENYRRIVTCDKINAIDRYFIFDLPLL